MKNPSESNEPSPFQLAIAARLRQARIAAGFSTAKSFAERLNLPQPTYAMYELGKRGLSCEAAVQFTQALGVSLNWLLTGTEEGAPRTSTDINIPLLQTIIGTVMRRIANHKAKVEPDRLSRWISYIYTQMINKHMNDKMTTEREEEQVQETAENVISYDEFLHRR